MQNLLPAETSLRGHQTRGSCKEKPLSLRASCLLFGGRVFEKPLLFPPDGHHCECHQNSQRDCGEAMRRTIDGVSAREIITMIASVMQA